MRHNWMEVFELGGYYRREWRDSEGDLVNELWVEVNKESGEVTLTLEEDCVVRYQAVIKRFGDDQFVILREDTDSVDSLFCRLAMILSDPKSDPPQMNQRNLNMFIKRCETILALMIP